MTAIHRTPRGIAWPSLLLACGALAACGIALVVLGGSWFHAAAPLAYEVDVPIAGAPPAR